jgi:hypothetical protein
MAAAHNFEWRQRKFLSGAAVYRCETTSFLNSGFSR